MSEQPAAHSADLALALELANIADSISLPRFQSADFAIDAKPDSSFVTDADIAVERALRERIELERPEDGFLGEESGRADSGARRWVIDPIDGTHNYMRGVPNWATLIALEVDDQPVIGVVSAPAFGTRWYAEVGGGAWREDHGATPRRLHVSGVDELGEASLSFQSIEQWRDAGRLDTLLTLAELVWRDRAFGDMWSYMLLAEGHIDIVGEFDVKPYDLAALAIVVREAGGTFTDMQGNETVWNGSALATNGKLHGASLAAIGERP